jgi:uncharacterized membrane protein YgdD (TMEM256/DUF423 family)
MDNGQKYYGIFAGLGGFFGVALGALAAHKAHDAYAAELLKQASTYTLIHSLTLLFVCKRPGKIICLACFLFALGILLFCGGLAVKALTGVATIGWLIPFGGGCLMSGWLAVAAAQFTRNENQAT